MVCHVLRVPGGTKTREHCVSLFVQPLSAYTLSAGGSGELREPCRGDPKAVDLRASYRHEKKTLSSRVPRDLLFSTGCCL